MKYCNYCGKEYPDEVDLCPADRHTLQRVGETPSAKPSAVNVPTRDEISPEEQRFWNRMTFRQFAILMIRLQALWLFLNAILDLTYLSRYFDGSATISAFSALTSYGKREFFMLLLRIFINVGAGMALIQKAEKVLSWLVKDYVSQSSTKTDQ